jgi:hypothetical protein
MASPLSPLGLAKCLHLSGYLALADGRKSSGRASLDDDFDFDLEELVVDFEPALNLEDEVNNFAILDWFSSSGSIRDERFQEPSQRDSLPKSKVVGTSPSLPLSDWTSSDIVQISFVLEW